MSVLSLPFFRPVDRWVACLLFLLATAFYAAILRYAINVPEVDDFLYVDSIRRILADGTPLWEQIRLLVEQHNDHRILLSRLIVLADYLIEGQVNYRTLTLLGSLSVAGLLWQVYRLFRQAGLAFWLVLPVALLLFQPSYQEDVWWVLCLLQHTLTLLLMVAVLRLITRPQVSAQVSALTLGGLVLYSNSNGLFMWIAIIGILLLTRRWRMAVVWTCIGLVFTGLYFGVNYNFIAKNSLATVSQHPGWVLKSLISFLGSAIYFDQRRWLLLPGQWLVLGLGVVVLLVIVGSWVRLLFTLKRPIPRSIVPFLGLGLVLAGSGVAAALVRSEGNLMIIGRYQLYAVWCLIVVYGLLLMQLTGRFRQVTGWLGMAFAGWFWLNAWLHYGPQLADRYNRQVAEGVALRQYGYSVLSQLFGQDVYWQKGWAQALDLGIYRVPVIRQIRGIEAAMRFKPAQDSVTRFTTTTRPITYLNTEAFFVEQDTLLKPDFLYMRSAQNWYILPAQRMPKPILKPWLADKGVRSSVLPAMIHAGTYRLGWIRHTEKGWFATLTQDSLQVLK